MADVRIAVGQAVPVSGSVRENIEAASRLVEAASHEGAALLLLGESFLSAYDLDQFALGPERVAIDPNGDELAPLQAACAHYKVSTVVGACLKRPKGVANSAFIIGEDGSIRATYDKIHLWTTERDYFVPGNQRLLIEIAGFRTGLAICYDAGFPEHCRDLALAGAELILCPSAFSRGDEESRYNIYFPMRALENTVYVAVANLIGRAAGLDFYGRSQVFDPSGALVAEAGPGEGIVIADISHDRIAAVRDELRYLEHRRPECYGPLSGEEIEDGVAAVSSRRV